jgi:hypothetical protein
MFLGHPGQRLVDELTRENGQSWAAMYGRLLILYLLGELPSRTPELAIPLTLWPVVEAGIRRLIDETEPLAWDDGAFRKDLAVALLRAVPNDAIIVIALRKRPRNLLRAARTGERLAVLREFGVGYLRRSWVLGIHQWRGVERWMREPGEPRVLRTAELMAANPRLAAVTHSGWINDPQLDTIAPAIAARAAIYLRAGGYRFHMRNAPSTVEGALTTSSTRRRLYEEGSYRPANFGIIVKRERLLAWARTGPNTRDGLASIDRPGGGP